MTLSLGGPVYVFVLAPYASGILFVLLWLCRATDILDGTSPGIDLSELKIALSIFFSIQILDMWVFILLFM